MKLSPKSVPVAGLKLRNPPIPSDVQKPPFIAELLHPGMATGLPIASFGVVMRPLIPVGEPESVVLPKVSDVGSKSNDDVVFEKVRSPACTGFCSV